ncbi:MAG: hypothetical protein ISN29_05455 [Gammaproteobacteria bacterium AqS3]|nr:hypothetical protein [Gammaproteobacteria bacterium AqS3]
MGIILGVIAVVIVAAVLKHFLGKSRQHANLIEFRTRLMKAAHNSEDDRATEKQIDYCVRMLDEAGVPLLPEVGDTLTKKQCSDLIVRLQLAVVDSQEDPDEIEAEQMQYFASSAAESAEYRFSDAKYCLDDIVKTMQEKGLTDDEGSERLLREAKTNLQQCKKAVAEAEEASDSIYGDDGEGEPTPKQIRSACERALRACQSARAFEQKIQAALRSINGLQQGR